MVDLIDFGSLGTYSTIGRCGLVGEFSFGIGGPVLCPDGSNLSNGGSWVVDVP